MILLAKFIAFLFVLFTACCIDEVKTWRANRCIRREMRRRP